MVVVGVGVSDGLEGHHEVALLMLLLLRVVTEGHVVVVAGEYHADGNHIGVVLLALLPLCESLLVVVMLTW